MSIKTVKKITLSLVCLSLAGCGMFSEDKIILDGDRISVLDGETILQADFLPNQVKIELPEAATNISWEQSGGNAMHDMEHPNSGDMITQAWSANFGEGGSKRDFIIAAPIVKHKVAFTIDADATVRAFRMDNGENIWESKLKPFNKSDRSAAMKGAGLAANNKVIYATTGFGAVAALDMMTGKKLWVYNAELPIRIAPTVSDNYVFVQTIDNILIALNAENGKELWKYKSTKEATTLVGGASPAYDATNDVVVAAFSSGELRAIKASTGTPLWSVLMVSRKRINSLSAINSVKANPVIKDNVVYAAGNNNVLMAIDLRTGIPVWEREVSSVNQPWVVGKYLYILSNDADLAAIERSSGKIIWTTRIPLGEDVSAKSGVFLSGPVLTGYRLIVASSNGQAYAISPYSGKILGYIELDEGVVVPPVVAYDTVLFATNDAELTAYRQTEDGNDD